MNDISKASLQLSMYKVIQRKKDPIQQAKLYNMIFQYLYENIEPTEDDEFYDLFISWQPQMDFEISSKVSGKKGRETRAEKKAVREDKDFFNSSNTPYKGFQEPYASNVNVNVNVNENDNAHENVNVNERACEKSENQENQKNEIDAVPDYDESKITSQDVKNWGEFQTAAYDLITEHNAKADFSKKIFVSKDRFSFVQKECRDLITDLRGNEPNVILNALKNYLAVAKSDTWKSSFSIRNFIKEFQKYSDKDFTLTPFLKNKNAESALEKEQEKTPEQYEKILLEENKFNTDFIPEIFTHYHSEWVERGCPIGSKYKDFQDEKCLTGYGQHLKSVFYEQKAIGA